jgi:16S rRNA (uracil1498-N3)-methyltransferase
MHLFYTPLLEAHHAHFQLDEAESKHAIRVLRLLKGQFVGLRNGKGLIAKAEIVDDNPKRVVLSLRQPPVEQPVESQLHLIIAPTKNMDRMEWLLEKATEIGLSSLTPLICARSERKDVTIERLQKVAVAAMKQAQRAYVPLVHPAIKFNHFVQQMNAVKAEKWIAHCLEHPKHTLSPSEGLCVPTYIMIGPEGDFTAEEVEIAYSNGFKGLDLGSWRLRTETAGLVACMDVARLTRNHPSTLL